MMVREALAADIPALVHLRMALFCEVGELARPDEDPALWQATLTYFTRAQEEGSARSWLVEVDGEAVTCGTLALFVRPPYPGNLAGREAYLLNMYTRPAWRKRGMASILLDAMAAHAREQRLGKLWLHASDQGRPLYERLGFVSNPACLEWCPAP
ncbi:GNAT family N-acetyltransferase [Aeromonas media]|uniref:GNAT family N-acetyltransferase n=1 Tax=Aeromonas media TaxID=651 RepID=UPI0029DA30C0|nr:GNAT family N-acetyltransferase [Aeromonas media]MDX7899674.1 GNAT family N-acetyltransferase [Aeromonas media]